MVNSTDIYIESSYAHWVKYDLYSSVQQAFDQFVFETNQKPTNEAAYVADVYNIQEFVFDKIVAPEAHDKYLSAFRKLVLNIQSEGGFQRHVSVFANLIEKDIKKRCFNLSDEIIEHATVNLRGYTGAFELKRNLDHYLWFWIHSYSTMRSMVVLASTKNVKRGGDEFKRSEGNC